MAVETADRPQSYFATGWGARAWLATTDHKRVAWLYFAALTFFFFIGGAMAVTMRLELASPAGDLVSDDIYNRLFSIHGIIMIWFFLVPSIPATLGNFLLPLMLGARDLAFPRLNLASWYVFMAGSLFALFAVVAGGWLAVARSRRRSRRRSRFLWRAGPGGSPRRSRGRRGPPRGPGARAHGRLGGPADPR